MVMRNWTSICFLLKQASDLKHLHFSHQRFYMHIFLSKFPFCPVICTEGLRSLHTSNIIKKERKTREQKKFKNIIQFRPKSKQPTVSLWKGCNAFDIADATKRNLDDVFEAISYLENSVHYKDPGIEINNTSAILGIAKRLGYRVEFVKNPKLEEVKEKSKDLVKRPPPDIKDLVKRPPVVAIMGHVDHGKTTLLDALRHSSIVSQEHGGITQHIGAFTVNLPEGQITFLDTPGHAAFRTMRARGAQATDLVVLVVAADDSIMEQTLESVRFAKEANVPIIVAINKIDKDFVNIDKVKQDLLNIGIQVEDLGGEVQAIPISALKKMNLNVLIEAILTQAEIMGIGGDPKGLVEGVVLEASLDTLKGKVSTALIQRGTLKKGCILVAGTAWAKVRAMYDEYGKQLTEVSPGMPVQVIGWKEFPLAGEIILQADSEKHAREVVHYREQQKMEEKMADDLAVIEKKAQLHNDKYKQERQARLMRGRYRKERNYFREKESVEDNSPFLSFVLKGDVHGSVEAILDVVNTYDYHDSCRLDVIHSGVGNVTENDILLAESFDGIIYTFNVKVPPEVKKLAEEKDVLIKPFNVIYHLIADVKAEISNRLPLVEEEDVLGEATVLQEFLVKDKKNKIPVAGCKCTKGILKKNSLCKIVRANKAIYNGPIKSLRHEKSDVESIKKDVECGLMLEDPEISFQPGDIIICYNPKSVAQVTDWNPGF
ncbi:translation initiation factor IF-2, mitochondrial [Trichonephila inaurata madagascariensis]|uniref:Translation initiation factor IF-2, mitochondrial n=1 Tax=Trichonephila inaurata madagascariensis TaxID=2747483 RepID=A0A8X6MBR3_9ARAC|nr:translation initiation factor IF-2, mitochondrial [Trichonephila inaurata madagascariensis]